MNIGERIWVNYVVFTINNTYRYVAIINTYLALCSACVATFITSTLTNPKKKITMEHIQNATLAG